MKGHLLGARSDTVRTLPRLRRLIVAPPIGNVTGDELDRRFAAIHDPIDASAADAPIHLINPKARGGVTKR